MQLLLGEIPDRAIFRRAMLRRALAPYRDLTQGASVCVCVRARVFCVGGTVVEMRACVCVHMCLSALVFVCVRF